MKYLLLSGTVLLALAAFVASLRSVLIILAAGQDGPHLHRAFLGLLVAFVLLGGAVGLGVWSDSFPPFPQGGAH